MRAILGALCLMLGLLGFFRDGSSMQRSPAWLLFALLAIGISLLVSWRAHITVFDKESGTGEVTHWYPYRRVRQSIRLEQVMALERAFEANDGAKRRHLFMRLYLCLATGKIIIREPAGLLAQLRHPLVRDGEAIAAFLGVPFEDRRLPTATEELEAVKDAFNEEIVKREEGDR